jgi:hypothetical protein
VFEVSAGIKTAPSAAFDDGVNDGATFAGIGMAHEEPVLLTECRGPDGVFNQIIVDLHAAVSQKDGLASVWWTGGRARPGDKQGDFRGANGSMKLQPSLALAQPGLHTLKVLGFAAVANRPSAAMVPAIHGTSTAGLVSQRKNTSWLEWLHVHR